MLTFFTKNVMSYVTKKNILLLTPLNALEQILRFEQRLDVAQKVQDFTCLGGLIHFLYGRNARPIHLIFKLKNTDFSLAH